MAQRGAGFWNLLAKRYARQPIADEESYRYKLAETRKILSDSARVLEFGCGTGSTALEHAPFVSHIDGIDFSRSMIAIAQQKAKDAGVANVRFEIADITTYEASDPYDVVLGMSILHLLNDRRAVISKVYDILTPGGVFVSSTMCLGNGAKMLRAAVRMLSPLGVLPTVAFFSQDDLKAEMAKAGFLIEQFWCPGPGKASFVIARKPA